MKKWSEIQQATLNKMFMVLTDINEDVNDYLSKMIGFANEALIFIANDICPNVREITLEYAGDLNYDMSLHNIVLEKYKYYRAKEAGVFDGIEVAAGDYVYSNGTDWVISRKNLVFKMPEDFISFADISPTFNPNEYTRDKTLKMQKNAQLLHVGRDSVVLPYLGTYKLYYYALYSEIPLDLATTDADRDLTKDHFDESGNLIMTGISQSVLNTLPSYIASQLQAQDDPQRSTILRNEFELMSSRLESNNLYNIEGFISEGDWV